MIEEVEITQGVDKSSATPSVDQDAIPENTEEEKDTVVPTPD